MNQAIRDALDQEKRNLIFDFETLTACHGDTQELILWAIESLLLLELKLGGVL